MTNKTLGVWLLVPLGVSVLIALFEAEMTYSTADTLYMIAGLLMFVFNIWASIRLIKSGK